MSEQRPTTSPTCQAISQHILTNLQTHRQTSRQPLMVLMQGPQGSGKTTLTRELQRVLSSSDAGSLQVAIMSLDDFYLDHQGLVRVAAEHPDNAMLQGRGLPGTHDLELGRNVLEQLSRINSDTGRTVHLPVFDKSLFGGAGDRSRETVQVQGPLDVVVLEGWCCGFSPLGEDEIRQRHAKASPVEVFGRHPIESLLQIETNFQTLASTLYPCFTTMITIIPSSLEHVYSWRLQAEHAMKAANGGSGMSDDEVRRFVDRYMPVYELWGGIQGVKREPWAKQWQGRGLAVYIDAQREVIKTERF